MTEVEEVVEEKCDGSGWITHGDGHKTECPGCSACQDKVKPKPEPKPEPSPPICKCGCQTEGCDCQQSGKCFPLPEEAVKKNDSDSSKELEKSLEEPTYLIYHFGAQWCGPCEQMKKQTWDSSRVKKAIEDKDAKLYIFDEANPEHKKYFFYYKVKSYPTIIFLDSDDLNNPTYRSTGFMGPTDMVKTITERLKDE